MSKISRFVVRTSGRRVMRRCLRKWGFQSSMKMNLQRKGTEQNINFWFGSGIHFAMEDYFGYNRFGDPIKAFQGYFAAFPAYDRPEGADEAYYLGLGMLDYYKQWYPKHNDIYGFQTVWLNPDNTEAEPGTPGARPLVEESFLLDLGIKVWVRDDTEAIIDVHSLDGILHVFFEVDGQKYYRSLQCNEQGQYYFNPAVGGILTGQCVNVSQVPVYYHGTLDRVVKDRQGRWWIQDYKTAKSADTNKLDTDDQISAYMWAAEQWFQRPVHGFMYTQLTKDVPKPPKRLAGGGMSVDKKQKTTYQLARQMVIHDYGEVRKAPAKVLEYINFLASEELPEGDRFIRWDAVLRNKAQKEATYRHIMGELQLALNPNVYLFPNPTRDCIWDCPFRDACLMMDRGEEAQVAEWLEMNFEPRPREEDGNIDNWRDNIPWPDTPQGKAIAESLSQIELTAHQTLNLILPDKYRDMDE